MGFSALTAWWIGMGQKPLFLDTLVSLGMTMYVGHFCNFFFGYSFGYSFFVTFFSFFLDLGEAASKGFWPTSVLPEIGHEK